MTVITAHGGNPLLARCVESVAAQSWGQIQHLVVADGPHHWAQARSVVDRVAAQHRIDLIQLPYSIGKDRWNGHRIYAAASFIAEGEYIAFLDDDNAFEPEHIESCLELCRQGRRWSYALRNIVDREHRFICRDDCESLGRWPSILHPEDYLIDVNCYFLPRLLAVQIAPLWFRRSREPGQPEVDRVICHALKRIAPEFDCTHRYSVNYLAGNTPTSVQPEFFLRGNEEMLRQHGGQLPWRSAQAGQRAG
ncbi:MAG TPA: glycosyltransferase family A protein [Variovorax sp.]|nr:glycosyltransferase family A protein [Variovorax sp.]